MATSTDKIDQSDEEDFELTDTEEPFYIVEAPRVDSALLAISLDFLLRLNFLRGHCNIPYYICYLTFELSIVLSI